MAVADSLVIISPGVCGRSYMSFTAAHRLYIPRPKERQRKEEQEHQFLTLKDYHLLSFLINH